MQQVDFQKFKAMIAGVAECYGQTLTAEGIAIRFKMLTQFEFPDVEKAALSILSSRKYTSMPTPADFLEYLGGGSLEDQAEIEAGKVLESIARIGGNSTVVFDNPTTMAVIQNAYGGWPKMCQDCGVEESEKWFRHNFAKTWAAYKRQGIQVFGTLPGRDEIANSASGHFTWIPKPLLVGDQAMAQKVLEMGPQEVPRQLTKGAVSFATVVQRTIPGNEAMGFEQ